MTNGEFKIKRRKGKWKRKQVVCRDCNMQPVRVGDIVRLRYDQLVAPGEWDEVYIECEVVGMLKGCLPMLAVLANGNIWGKDFDPEEDLEKIEMTEEQEAILNADMEAEMRRLEPYLYEV